MTSEEPGWKPFAGDASKVMTTINTRFSPLGFSEREDLAQQVFLIAHRRGLLSKGLTWREASNLVIDAYRDIYRTRRGPRTYSQYVPTESEVMEQLADPPNQWSDMAKKDKLLTPEEEAFENELEAQRGTDVAREIETGAALGNTPMTVSDMVRACERIRDGQE